MDIRQKERFAKRLYELLWLAYMSFNLYWLFVLEGDDKTMGLVLTWAAMLAFWIMHNNAVIIYHSALGAFALALALFMVSEDALSSQISNDQLHKLIIIAGANILISKLLKRSYNKA